MAPDADIIAIQVFSVFRGAACGGRSPCIASFTSDQIRALDFVLQLAAERRIAAANLSLGGGRSETACDDDPAKLVIDELREANVAVVIAAGNDGFRDAVSFPACISTAVTVGATDDADRVAPFSNRGALVDLHAPGVAITSSVPAGRFAPFNGTSMATPHVAGAFASLRSLRPDASLDQIGGALASTGVDTGGRPRIRLLDAANVLRDLPAAEQAAGNEAPTMSSMQPALAQLEALPADQTVRLIVGVTARPGETRSAALARAEVAARQAGASYVGGMGGQPLLVIEATPAQAAALLQSGAISSIQIDQPARTQP
jgi:subtilisin family serine protease